MWGRSRAPAVTLRAVAGAKSPQNDCYANFNIEKNM